MIVSECVFVELDLSSFRMSINIGLMVNEVSALGLLTTGTEKAGHR